MGDATKTLVTAQEFFALPESNQIRELINGEIVVNPPKDRHQKVSASAYSFLDRLELGGELRYAPTGLYLDDIDILEPDIFWVSSKNDHCSLGDDDYWYGAPDLVVEILSPSSIRYDRVEKFQLYEKYGVREYWIVDPNKPSIEIWVHIDGKLVYQGEFTTDKTFTSTVLDMKVDVKRLLAK